MPARLLDSSAAAEYLGVKERHLKRLRDERRIPFVKVGRLVRYDVRQLERWIDAQTTKAAS